MSINKERVLPIRLICKTVSLRAKKMRTGGNSTALANLSFNTTFSSSLMAAKIALFFLFSRSFQTLNAMRTKICAVRHPMIAIFPLLYPGFSDDWKACVPRMLPTQKDTSFRALTVLFLECPARLEAFHARRSMNAAPKVPERQLAKRSQPLECAFGMPVGSRPCTGEC